MEKYQIMQYVSAGLLLFFAILSIQGVLDENLTIAFQNLVWTITSFVLVSLFQYLKPQSQETKQNSL